MVNVLVTGEVLFDTFEDGAQILGGAPFNVAWHLQGLGFSPLFVSRVGDDANGEKIRNAMSNWGMSTSGLQTDPTHATGTVRVSVVDDEPHYAIEKPVAYDFIQPVSINQELSRCKLIYHGSLVMRSEVSRKTLLDLKSRIDIPVFVDINLRPPHWSKDVLALLLQRVNWLKLNEHELRQLAAFFLKEKDKVETEILARDMCELFSIHSLILTRGADGATLVTQDEIEDVKACQIVNFVDSVGAGDGFSAMFIFGLLSGWDNNRILSNASLFAAKICELRGAISYDRSFYESILQQIT